MASATLVLFQMGVVVKARRWWEQSIEVLLLSRNLHHLQRYMMVACEQSKDDLQIGLLNSGARVQPPHYVAKRCDSGLLSVRYQYLMDTPHKTSTYHRLSPEPISWRWEFRGIAFDPSSFLITG
jgi:hypothetical protein